MCSGGQNLQYRGEFTRKGRISLLCFMGQYGLMESYFTDETHHRTTFVDKCRKFALESGKVSEYPGIGSIWIMDGASIHCHPDILYYFRSFRYRVDLSASKLSFLQSY